MNKTTTILLSAGIVLATGVGVYYLINKNNKKKLEAQKQAKKYFSTEVPINAKDVANTLFEAMEGTGKSALSSIGQSIGTDVNMILEALSNVSYNQFKQVIKAFGNRPYNPIFGNNRFAPFQKVTKYPLKFWLKKELTDKDYQILKSKYSNLL